MENVMKELKAELSSVRKKGADVKQAEMQIKQIEGKLKLALIAGEEEMGKVRKAIEGFRDEIGNAWLDAADKIIEKLDDFTEMNEMDNAEFYYKELMQIYGKLTNEQKAKLKDKCIELRKKILNTKK